LGWDISLDLPDEFARVLEAAAKFDDIKWGQMRQCCIQFASEQAKDDEAVERNRHLFSGALSASAA
jgi:hypothetical protein